MLNRLEIGFNNKEVLSNSEKAEILRNMEFIKLDGGPIQLGTEKPLICTLEGRRWNETPTRDIEVAPFYMSKIKVTNAIFEMFNPKHIRVSQSMGDDMPVVDVMYGEALTFCKKLNALTGMDFRLPTEPEWTFAAAPKGWEYSYQEEARNPKVDLVHVYGDGQEHGAVPVNDPRWKPNLYGLDQMGHNVSEMTLGHYRVPQGAWGAEDDGMYFIAKGGNYGHCAYSAGVQRRLLVDVSDRNPRLGFRLAHDNI